MAERRENRRKGSRRPSSADQAARGSPRRRKPRPPVSRAQSARALAAGPTREEYLLFGTPPGAQAVEVVVQETAQGSWVARAWIVPRGGIPVVGKIELGFVDRAGRRTNEIPQSGVTARVLRELRLTRVFDAARAQIEGALSLVEDALEQTATGSSEAVLAKDGYMPRAKRQRESRGRKPFPMFELAEVARDYAALVDAGTANPNRELAERRNVSRKWIEELVRRARTEGLLSPAPVRGRAGGILTERARTILESNADTKRSSARRGKKR